tara:strand:- start:615 stop:1478 length:864 start_codon:yes stop_codon:yes gene_type:complete
MPELPEVEVVRQSLAKRIINKKIRKVIVRNRNLRFKLPHNFENYLKNKKISKIGRFSKYLILYFSDNSYCLIHLGMSGTIHIINKNKKNKITNLSFYNSPTLPKKHNHIEINFEEFKIIYNDPRRFGFFQLIKSTSDLRNKFLHLGPEPFNKKFNSKYVYSYFYNKKKNIKSFLLDQNFVSGIGNIYASEILFMSKIKPTKNVNSLSKIKCRSIILNSKKVLLNAINKGGSSIRNFKDAKGKIGNFQKNFKVYQREGLNCKRVHCKGVIKKKIISKRSTFYCSLCQK